MQDNFNSSARLLATEQLYQVLSSLDTRINSLSQLTHFQSTSSSESSHLHYLANQEILLAIQNRQLLINEILKLTNSDVSQSLADVSLPIISESSCEELKQRKQQDFSKNPFRIVCPSFQFSSCPILSKLKVDVKKEQSEEQKTLIQIDSSIKIEEDLVRVTKDSHCLVGESRIEDQVSTISCGSISCALQSEDLQSISADSMRLPPNQQKRYERLLNSVQELLNKLNISSGLVMRQCTKFCEEITRFAEITKYRTYESISAWIVLKTTQSLAIPVSVKKLSGISGVREKVINRTSAFLQESLVSLKHPEQSIEETINILIEKLSLSREVKELTSFLLTRAEETAMIVGKNKKVIASSLVKLAAAMKKVNISSDEAARISGIAGLPVKKFFKVLFNSRFELIADNRIAEVDFKTLVTSNITFLE